ncbi:MAG: C25 family cysteine peptidase [Anaerolineaceae bacterium]
MKSPHLRNLFKILKIVFVFLLATLMLGATIFSVNAQSGSGGWLNFGTTPINGAPQVDLIQADSLSITLQANLPGASIDQVMLDGQTYIRLGGDGYVEGGEIGAPSLPVLRRDIEIPFGAQVNLEILSLASQSTSLEALGLTGLIAPRQSSQPKCGEAASAALPDGSIYESLGAYPEEVVRVTGEYIVRGHRMVQLEIWPVRYTPSTGELETISEISVRLNLDGSDMIYTNTEADRLNSKAFNDIYADTILNYNQGRPLVQPQVGEKYLVVAADTYVSGLADFVSLKQTQGYDVTLASLSTVGGTDTTSIKNYIRNWYLGSTPPVFVLLVGDVNDGADSIPNYNFRSESSDFRTDLYYFTMDNESEWVPDILYGRFPVRDATQLANMINKIEAYEAASGAEPWVKKAAFLASDDGGYYQVAEGTHNYVINTYTLPKAYSGIFPTNPYPGGDKLYAITYDAESQDVVNSINNDRVMVVYSGHGSSTSWAGPSLNQTQVRALTGVAVPYVAGHACITSDFTVNESFGDTWVIEPVNGALTYLGASNYSYWDEDDTLERAIFDTLFRDPLGIDVPSIGEMKHAGLVAVDASNTSLDQYYWEEYHLFGDPSLIIVLGPRTPDFTLTIQPDMINTCNSGSNAALVNVGSLNQYDTPVDLTASTVSGFSFSFDPTGPITPPGASTLNINGDGTAAFGANTVSITGTSGSLTHSTDLLLNVFTPLSSGPALLLPANGAEDVDTRPTFTWQAVTEAQTYHLQVATDAGFANIVIDEPALVGTSYEPVGHLQTDTIYYWRVSADNPCGATLDNQTFTFRTKPGPGDCPTGTTAQTLYFTDFENGSEGWMDASSGSLKWVESTARSHSPVTSWLGTAPAVIADQRLVSPTFSLPSDELPLSLAFWHRWTFDSPNVCNDGGVLEISTNGGASWSAVSASKLLTNPYTGTVKTGVFNPLAGKSAWCGVSDWVWTVVDLEDYQGEDVLFRFRLGTGNTGSAEGWYLDDVRVQSCVQDPLHKIYIPILTR